MFRRAQSLTYFLDLVSPALVHVDFVSNPLLERVNKRVSVPAVRDVVGHPFGAALQAFDGSRHGLAPADAHASLTTGQPRLVWPR